MIGLEDRIDEERMDKEVADDILNLHLEEVVGVEELVVVFYDQSNPFKTFEGEGVKSYGYMFKKKWHEINVKSFDNLGAYNDFRFGPLAFDSGLRPALSHRVGLPQRLL